MVAALARQHWGLPPDAAVCWYRQSAFDDHAGAHFQVQGVAEVRAIAPEHARLVGNEGHRGRLLRVDDEADVVLLSPAFTDSVENSSISNSP